MLGGPSLRTLDTSDPHFGTLTVSLAYAECRKAKTPQSKLRGLSIDLLVGVEGLEPPTLSV